MEATHVDSASERVMVTIFNNSSYTLFTGLHFVVEVFDEGTWRVVPWREGVEAAFADVAYIIQPGDEIDFVKDLSLFHQLSQDIHRIRMVEINDDLGGSHDVVVEFYMN